MGLVLEPSGTRLATLSEQRGDLTCHMDHHRRPVRIPWIQRLPSSDSTGRPQSTLVRGNRCRRGPVVYTMGRTQRCCQDYVGTTPRSARCRPDIRAPPRLTLSQEHGTAGASRRDRSSAATGKSCGASLASAPRHASPSSASHARSVYTSGTCLTALLVTRSVQRGPLKLRSKDTHRGHLLLHRRFEKRRAPGCIP